VLSYFGQHLRSCLLYQAVYASFYSYSYDVHISYAFCENWCLISNTLHIVTGEMLVSLWDLHRIGGLLINGLIYDKTIVRFRIGG